MFTRRPLSRILSHLDAQSNSLSTVVVNQRQLVTIVSARWNLETHAATARWWLRLAGILLRQTRSVFP